MSDDPQFTIEQALRILGANKAFLPADTGFARACVALIRIQQPLTGQQRDRAWRMLARYEEPLGDAGLSYAQIERPASASNPSSTTPAAPAAQPSAVPGTNRSRLYIDVKGRLVAETPFSLKPVIQDVPGGRYGGAGTGVWLYQATPPAAEALLEALAPFGCDYSEAVGELVAQAHKIKEAAVHKSATDLPAVPNSKTDAWLHQRQAFWFAKDLAAAMLDMEMGTGKSKVVVDLVVNSGAEKVLITCPERVVGVWPKQFGIHAGRPVHVIDPRRQTRNGEWKLMKVADRVAQADEALHECRCGLPHVILTNYAASAHEPFKSWSVKQHWDYVAYDEAHRLKSGSGTWSRWSLAMTKCSDRRIGGTGTLMPQGPLDVFGSFRALDPGLFGTAKSAFNKRYAEWGGYEDREIKRYIREDELAQKIASITYRVGAEVLDLPDEVPDVVVTTQLEPKAWRVYKDLEDEAYAELLVALADGTFSEDSVLADNILVKLLRLQQVTGGFVKLDSGELLELGEPNAAGEHIAAKEKLLEDDLEDIPRGEPVVVFAKFHHDLDVIERVARRLGRPYGELSGRRSDALTQDATLSEHLTVAGVQIQSGGTGIDFTRSCYGTYFSVGYSLGDYLQSRARLRRPGQTRSVRFRHLVVEGTIDEDVYAALEARESVTKRLGDKIRGLQMAAGSGMGTR